MPLLSQQGWGPAVEPGPYAFLFKCSRSASSYFESINTEVGKKIPTALELNSGASSQHVDQNTRLVCVLVKKQLVT